MAMGTGIKAVTQGRPMAIVTCVLTLEIPAWISPLSAQNLAASCYSISIRADLPIEKSVSTGNRG